MNPITQDGVLVKVGQIWRRLGNGAALRDQRVLEVRGAVAAMLPRGDERGEVLNVPIREMHKHLSAEWKLAGWELIEMPNERIL